ncbi:hypothetical protein CPB84DRAFT_1769157 [Gymnopilus junonius]|uniref:Uncharacterized protein n=1 Tax=Gymnopilus junonius TaxID=109634 RepID=A0A9P5TRL5_GYMJU|nr:hypothetical protein CPB84DRAFT_1769157 [Gymnopilus junonius]
MSLHISAPLNKLANLSGDLPKRVHKTGAITYGNRFFSASLRKHGAPRSSLTVQTLDPTKMSRMRQKPFDISGKKSSVFRMPSEGSRVILKYGFEHGATAMLPFPPGTVGVLYFHQPSDRPLLAGAIRMRLCSDVERFAEAEDLKSQDGEPWQTGLYSIAKYNSWKGFRQMLLRESLVEHQIISDLQNLPLSPGNNNFHYELEQPFILDLEHPTIVRTFIDRSRMFSFSWGVLNILFKPYEEGATPYTGRMLVRLEPYRLEFEEPGLVLRILEVVTPLRCLDPAYDFLQPPVPGDLLRTSIKRLHYKGKSSPLFYSLTARDNGNAIAEFAGISLQHQSKAVQNYYQ